MKENTIFLFCVGLQSNSVRKEKISIFESCGILFVRIFFSKNPLTHQICKIDVHNIARLFLLINVVNIFCDCLSVVLLNLLKNHERKLFFDFCYKNLEFIVHFNER